MSDKATTKAGASNKMAQPVIDPAYRALMPPHYTARRNEDGTPKTDLDGSRKWIATRVPAIRVFGPFWSFGFNLYEPPLGATWPDGKGSALRGLRAMAESSPFVENDPLFKAHYPTLLSAHVKSFLQVSDIALAASGKLKSDDPKELGKKEYWESRMSLLAVRAIDPKHLDADGELKIFDLDDHPVFNGQAVETSQKDGQVTLIVAPFGDLHPKPDTTFGKEPPNKEEQDPKETKATVVQHLPAMQLLHGRVRFEPRAEYLKNVRLALGLEAPSAELGDGRDTIVLTPDGFALAGSVEMPWIEGNRVSGWFKVTFRRLDADQPLNVEGDPLKDKSIAPVLRPWFDPDARNDSGRAAWGGAIAQLELLLRNAMQNTNAPRWLDIRPNVRLSAENFFWPLEYDTAKNGLSILVRRGKKNKDVLGIDGAGLLARLADRTLAEAPLATLTIEPDAFLVTKLKNGFAISSETTLKYNKDSFLAAYDYALTGASSAETMSVATVVSSTSTNPEVTLAVPMIETADSLRQAMNLPRPAQKTNQPKVVPPLWVFTPLDEGWLHWPLPNATPGILNRLIDKEELAAAVAADPAPSEAADGISGAIMFGNRPGNPGYTTEQRNWAFTIGEPRQGSVNVTLEFAGANMARFSAAQIKLLDFTVSFDGVVPVTPFRQTPERLVPDHAERALATAGLRAVSPASLNPLERLLWNKTRDPVKFAVLLKNVTISRVGGSTPAVTRNAVDAGLSWSLDNKALGAKDDDVPWIWVRHKSLPAVQIMPLATAGKARNAPGEVRALAPFVYEPRGQAKLLYVCKPGALDMTRGTIALDPDPKGSVGNGGFLRPQGVRVAGANSEWPWRDELGMAVTTLPSLTLFTGLKQKSPGIPIKGDDAQWSAYPSYGITVVPRYDIALRDQFHALAIAPSKPDPDQETVPPLALFVPRLDNGPDGEGAPDQHRVTNGYDVVWSEMSRKAGLAALDRRDMFDAKGKLAGVFGEAQYHVGTVAFDFTIGTTTANKAIQSVTQIGGWSLGKIAGVTPAEIRFAGLPADGDLVGLAGSFERTGADGTPYNVGVRHGTAQLEQDDGGFTDQHGIDVRRLSKPADPILKTVTNRADMRSHQLLTLLKPMTVANSATLAFWCADVPVGEGSKSFLGRYADDHATRINGASLDSDPFAGFRWTLAGGGSDKQDVVVIDGRAFEPLVLTGLTIDTATKALKTVKIKGRLLLPVGAPDNPDLPRAGGLTVLTLTASGGKLVPAFAPEDELVWPLANPQTATGVVPTLIVENNLSDAKLVFGFADAVFLLPVKLQWPANSAELLTVTLVPPAVPAQPPSDLSSIVASKLELTIGRAASGQNGKPILTKAHAAALSFDALIGPLEARLEVKLTHDLLAAKDPSKLILGTFKGLAGISLEVELQPDRGAFVFGADRFAARWRLPKPEVQIPEKEPRPALLDGFQIAEGEGGCFATLKLDRSALNHLPKIDVVGLEEELQFELNAAPALTHQWANCVQPGALQLVRRRKPNESAPLYRLFGNFTIANVFSWPELAVAKSGEFEEASLPAKPAARFVHEAKLNFRGDVLRPEGNGFMIACLTAHTVGKPDKNWPAQAWSWQAHQVVRLLPRQAFANRLEILQTPKTALPADMQKSDTGFSPLLGPAGKPLTDYAAVPHFLHVAASGPGGIAGPLASRLLAAIKAARKKEESERKKDKTAQPKPFLTVDVSAHLLINFAAGSTSLTEPLILVSLPAVGFCVADGGQLPWAQDVDALGMFASEVPADTRILQSVTDGIAARSMPALEPALAGKLSARLGEASGRAEESAASVLLAQETTERIHRPVFQAVVLRKEKANWRPAWDLPGAATAMHLSALLPAQPNRSPIALGFRPFGGISGDDLFEAASAPTHPLRDKTRIDVAVYQIAMQRFRKRLLQDLVPGPGALVLRSQRPKPAAVLLRLVARSRDGGSQRVIVEQRETLLNESDIIKLRAGTSDWARLSLERLAPWAASGFASISIDKDGVRFGWSQIVSSARLPSGRTVWPQAIAPAVSETPAQRQLEQVPRPDTARPRVVAGYSPLAAEPRLFTSEPASTYGEDVADYRLTATGVAMAWSLQGGTGAVLGDASQVGQTSAYWLTDRYRPAFRPFSDKGPEITFALPDDYDAALPGSLVPANHTVPRFTPPALITDMDTGELDPAGTSAKTPDTGTAQAFAPAVFTASRISSRPGAMAVTRAGLSMIVTEPKRLLALDASQTPLVMRQPRPPILARNDRARASSHEPAPFWLSRKPTVILHGPRRAPFGASTLPVGLDRRPRSNFASRVLLLAPDNGIAGPQWDGAVTLAIEADFGSMPKDAWTVKSAAIVVGTDRYKWVPPKNPDRTDKVVVLGKRTELFEFYGTAAGSGTLQSARDALRATAPATLAVVEVTLAHQRDDGGNLLRQIRFEILSAGAGMPVPGVEAPLFFRFDDPEYNDHLQGLAKLAREPSPVAAGEDFVFAADLADIRPGQRLELALALRPASPGAPISKMFAVLEKHLFYDGAPVVLKVERQRPGATAATPLGSNENAIDGATAAPDNKVSGLFLPSIDDAAAAPVVFHAMKLNCALLKGEDEPQPALKPDDQLQLVLMLERADGQLGEKKYVPLVTLRFDVVATPDMPANQSSFAFLTLKPNGKSVPVHLFAAGPDATLIELVDPLDLVEGVVRRRAIYQWRSFHPAHEVAGVRFALQKTGGAGGSWLPNIVEGGWLAVPQDKPPPGIASAMVPALVPAIEAE